MLSWFIIVFACGYGAHCAQEYYLAWRAQQTVPEYDPLAVLTPERLAYLRQAAEESKAAEERGRTAPALDPKRPLCSLCGKDYARLPFGWCAKCNAERIPQE